MTKVFRNLTEVFLTLTEVFPCFFLSCKANARVKLAKTGHGPHSSTLACICVVRLLFVLFYVLFVCKCVLPPGDNPIAVNKYIISMEKVLTRILAFHKTTWISYVDYWWRETNNVFQVYICLNLSDNCEKMFLTLLSKHVSPGKGYYSAVFWYVDVDSKSLAVQTEINAGIYIQPPASQRNCIRIWLNCRDTLNSKLSLERYCKIKASQAHNMLVILSKPRWRKSGSFFKLLQK